MSDFGLKVRSFVPLFAISVFGSVAAAQLSDAIVPIIVAPAVPADAVAPAADSRAMVLAVPLREGWQVPTLSNGRPAMGISGATRWQFTTTATWPYGAVRWALARAIVAGGPETNTDLGFTAGLGVSQGGDMAELMADGGAFVDTGVLQAEIRTGAEFNVLDSVIVDGTQLVNPGASKGILARTIDDTYLSVGAHSTLTITENGPAYAMVKVEGTLVDPTGAGVIDFTCRLAFTWGSRDVEVQFTVRNANIDRPQHTTLGSLELRLKIATGNSPKASIATPDGDEAMPLAPHGYVRVYQGYSSAPTKDVLGSGTNWLSPITKLHNDEFKQEGMLAIYTGGVTYSGSKDKYPRNEWMDLTGSRGGCTYTIQHMPYYWPAALECTNSGFIDVGLFPPYNFNGYTWSWRQHESRTAVFSFHDGPAKHPVEVSRRADTPIVARIADPTFYEISDCFPYDMLSIDEQNLAYGLLGLSHVVDIRNIPLTVTRYLPTSNTGGDNNHDYIERLLASEFLRTGDGGQYETAMNLALWKSEWQIARSDNFLHRDDPGADNDDVPHTKNIMSDDEHRYRGGMVLAWHLSGDERILDALKDEVEILPEVYVSPQERSMYQTIVAIVELADGLNAWDKLVAPLRDRLRFFCSPIIEIPQSELGFGWDGPPGLGARGCYVNSDQNADEKAPGETYVTRGFISSSMGPRAMFRAMKYLGTDPDAGLAAGRLVDLANYSRSELYPYFANPADRHLVYSYGVQQKLVNDWEDTDFHPILIGMCEAWRLTGDAAYLSKGIEQIQGFRAHDKMEWIDKRLEAQHFLRAILDEAQQAGLF